LATLSTQDTGRRQTKQNKTQKTKKRSNTDPTKNTTQKTKKKSNTDPTKNIFIDLIMGDIENGFTSEHDRISNITLRHK
jgi:hypothetical protein